MKIFTFQIHSDYFSSLAPLVIFSLARLGVKISKDNYLKFENKYHFHPFFFNKKNIIILSKKNIIKIF